MVNLDFVYTDAVSNRNGFMTWKPHRKRHGFEEFTRNLFQPLNPTVYVRGLPYLLREPANFAPDRF